MGRYAVDFSDVEEFELLPEGKYEGVIDRLEFREARTEGKAPQIAVVIEITRGPNKGREAWQFLSLSDKAKFRLFRFFNLFPEIKLDDAEPFAWDDYFDDEDNRPLAEPDLEGEPVEFKIKHRTWNDETRADVEVVEWLGGSDVDDEDDEEEEEEPEPPKAKRSRKAKPAPEPEESEDDDEDEDDDDDEEEEEQPKPRRQAAASKAKAKGPARAASRRRKLS